MEVYGRGGPVAQRSRRRRAAGRRPPGPSRRRVAHPARFAGPRRRRGALEARLRRQGLAGRHRARHRAHQLLQRRRHSRSEFRRQPDSRFRIPSSTPISGIATSSSPPPSAAGKRAWLNFDGINWKADVFLNGATVGPHRRRLHARPVRRHRSCIHPGAKNALAVRIEKNATPGSIKEKTVESTTSTAARWAPTTPPITPPPDGIGSHRPRPQHRHLERRLPDAQRAGDHRESSRHDHPAAARHLARRHRRRSHPAQPRIDAA